MPEQNTAPQQSEQPVVYVDPTIGGGGNPVWQAIKSSKLLKIGLPLLLVALMPVVLLLSQQKQEDKSHASAATTLSFLPSSSNATPLSKATGDELMLDINVDPGTNLVSTIKLAISYDPTKLQLEDNGFTADKDTFPAVVQGPTGAPGIIQATLAIGADPTKAIQKPSHVGQLKFRVIGPTDQGQVTLVKFDPTSSASSLGAQDQATENVLATTQPAAIQISGVPFSANDNRPNIKGEYVDKNGKPITLPGAQVVLYKQGSTAGTVSKDAPTWRFDNLKKGSYRIDAKMIAGYDLLMGTCEGACRDGMKYTRDYSIRFSVDDKTVHVSVKYVPNGQATNQPSAGASSSASVSSVSPTEAVACTPTTADLNKDGRVDNADSAIIANCYHKSPSVPGCENADIDGSKLVDEVDLNCVTRGGH